MKDSEVTDIESMIEQLRAALEDAQDHKRKDCPKARTCGIDGCSRNRHRLLHGSEVLSETAPMTMLPHADDGRRPDVPREGAPAVTLTSCDAKTPTESYSSLCG